MIFLYNAIIQLYALAVRIAAWKNPKAKEFLSGRKNVWAELNAKLLPFENIPTHRIWMHCASLGEFEQGRPVLEVLRQKYPEALIVLSFFSPSGYTIRKNEALATAATYLPLDTPKNVHAFIELVNPTLVFFVKYDIWWHYLSQLYKRSIPTYLISAVYQQKQWLGFSFQKIYLKRALQFFTHIFLQDENSFQVLRDNGFQNISISGDTRIERVLNYAATPYKNDVIEKFKAHSKLVLCGSTWQADERFIRDWVISPAYSDWKFVIAPHSISDDRIKELTTIFPSAVLYSDAPEKNISDARLLIINNIGLLAKLYRYADIAYIGGGFGKSIHNTLEPAAFGVPIVFGHRYKKFIEAIYFVEHGGAFSFKDDASFKAIFISLSDAEVRRKAARVLTAYLERNANATEKIMGNIKFRD